MWNNQLVDLLFSGEEASFIKSIPISQSNQEDKQIWGGTAKGIFSVKSPYYIQREMELSLRAEYSDQKNCSKVWKAIWQIQVPHVMKAWCWRACQNILLTRENLWRRKVISDPSCPICGLEAETIFHILWNYPSAQDVWRGDYVKFQKACLEGPDWLRTIEHMLNKCTKEEFQGFVSIARKSWLRRNEFIHEGIFTHPDNLILSVKSHLREFHQSQASDNRTREKVETTSPSRWMAPSPVWFKAN